jgi:Cof subfamily protein (haloacid dehalogenase superfamily)
MYKLVALDMDGTTLNENRRLNERVVNSIREARRLGVKVVLCSGRGYRGIQGFLEKLELDELVISLNGAAVNDVTGNQLIFSQHIEPDISREMIKLCKEHGIFSILFIDKEMYVNSINERAEFYEAHDGVKVTAVGDLEKFYISQPVGKMLMVGEYEELAKLKNAAQQKFGEKLNVTFSLPYFLEAYSPLINKGIMLEKVAGYYGIKREEIIAMGDGENDIPMIEYAGLGIAMGNAVEHLKERADFITRTNAEDGVAFALERFIIKG